MRRVLGCGALYFALVFGAGFLLGILRVLWLAPRFGERWAELAEMPVMLAVIILSARWIAGRFALASTGQRLGTGIWALALLLAAEFALVRGLRGITLTEYFSGRDPVSGTAYCIMLAVFAAMPLLVARSRARGAALPTGRNFEQ